MTFQRFVWLSTSSCSALVSSPSGRPDAVRLAPPARGSLTSCRRRVVRTRSRRGESHPVFWMWCEENVKCTLSAVSRLRVVLPPSCGETNRVTGLSGWWSVEGATGVRATPRAQGRLKEKQSKCFSNVFAGKLRWCSRKCTAIFGDFSGVFVFSFSQCQTKWFEGRH